MSKGTWFWLFFVLAVLFSFAGFGPRDYFFWAPWGRDLMIFVLLGLLGWHNFGSVVK